MLMRQAGIADIVNTVKFNMLTRGSDSRRESQIVHLSRYEKSRCVDPLSSELARRLKSAKEPRGEFSYLAVAVAVAVLVVVVVVAGIPPR